jgi:hypothetical protein
MDTYASLKSIKDSGEKEILQNRKVQAFAEKFGWTWNEEIKKFVSSSKEVAKTAFEFFELFHNFKEE